MVIGASNAAAKRAVAANQEKQLSAAQAQELRASEYQRQQDAMKHKEERDAWEKERAEAKARDERLEWEREMERRLDEKHRDGGPPEYRDERVGGRDIGTSKQKFCTECGREYIMGAKFCPNCGIKL